mmetsp:Transcript_27351/g.43933  ORF Transcript_27351/g.43933 Transcript_27351/m.43933 type:complete len:264 (-) Transcript_27351:920-1711(-)
MRAPHTHSRRIEKRNSLNRHTFERSNLPHHFHALRLLLGPPPCLFLRQLLHFLSQLHTHHFFGFEYRLDSRAYIFLTLFDIVHHFLFFKQHLLRLCFRELFNHHGLGPHFRSKPVVIPLCLKARLLGGFVGENHLDAPLLYLLEPFALIAIAHLCLPLIVLRVVPQLALILLNQLRLLLLLAPQQRILAQHRRGIEPHCRLVSSAESSGGIYNVGRDISRFLLEPFFSLLRERLAEFSGAHHFFVREFRGLELGRFRGEVLVL